MPEINAPAAAKIGALAANATAGVRLLSLDVLRGFDMIWIVGGDALTYAVANLQLGKTMDSFSRQLGHADWEGLRCYDIIFPLFIFLIGVAIPLSLDRIVASTGRASAVRRVIRRTAVLFILGVLFYGGFTTPIAEIRLLGVLQRLALCYGAAGLLYLFVPRRGLVAIFVGLLAGYWALLTFVPVPGYGAGDFAETHNLTNWFDAHFLPLKKWDGDHDPEGLLSTLPAIASCLLGVFAGLALQDPRQSPLTKIGRFVIAGVVLLTVGYLWSFQFPLIKKIWTSSYVLVAGGWSVLLLAGFYWVIDVLKIQGWTAPFAWVGANPLAIYIISGVVDFSHISSRFFGGDVGHILDTWRPGLSAVVLALSNVVLCFALCGFLYRRKIFIRL